MRLYFKQLVASAALCFTVAVPMASTAYAEVSKFVIGTQNGAAYIPLMVMDAKGFYLKHAKKAGLLQDFGIVNLNQARNMNDGLLSGSIAYGALGTPGLVILNDKTKGEFKAIGSLAQVNQHLITTTDAASFKELASKDYRISLPVVKVSVQAVTLQMMAAKQFGADKFDSMDKGTVSLPHPDGAAALISKATTGKGEVNSVFTTQPFSSKILAETNGNARIVAKSYDFFGGKATLINMVGSEKFARENPKTHKAFFDALKESQEWIANNKVEAAKLYVEKTGGKAESIKDVLDVLSGPDISYDIAPYGFQKYADFLYSVGTVKNKRTVNDLTFKELHGLKGN